MADANSTPNLKICSKCNCSKETSAFPKDGARYRACLAEYKRSRYRAESPEARAQRNQKHREYVEANRVAVAAYKRQWQVENSGSLKDFHAQYYKQSEAKIKARASDWKKNNPERRLENNRRWVAENPAKATECNRKNKSRRLSCPVRSMHERAGNLIRQAFRLGGYTKESRSAEIIGCDWEFFKLHIERQFTDGMSWENRKLWHIDHIIPLATAQSLEDVTALNHFTNLRPMWAADNIRKGAKVQTLL